MGDAYKDLIFAACAATALIASVYTGIWWLAMCMAFVLGSMLTFALCDWRDAERRKAGLLTPHQW